MEIIVSQAPARVCLFGDHQDYLGLPIIACAINRHIHVEAKRNNSEILAVYKKDLNVYENISITSQFDTLKKDDYLKTGLKVLRRYGCIPSCGYDITIWGNIAINAGTSSSSALLIAWIRFLIQAFGCSQQVSDELIAQIAYEAEVLEHGTSGGKMDQYSIALGNIIYLETDEKAHYQSINHEIQGLIVAESGVPKPTNAVLKELKTKALQSIDQVKESYPEFDLKTAAVDSISQYSHGLDAELKPYFEAAIENHNITQQALQELQKTSIDFKTIGALMSAHHKVLKEKLHLSIPKIDTMIDAAMEAGAYGSKIVGSGRGGCIVVLAPKEKTEAIITNLLDAGAVNAYEVSVDSGARIVE